MIFSFCYTKTNLTSFMEKEETSWLLEICLRSQNSHALTPMFNNLSSIYLDCLSIDCLLPELLATQPSVTQPSVAPTACHPNNLLSLIQTCVMLGQLDCSSSHACIPLFSSILFCWWIVALTRHLNLPANQSCDLFCVQEPRLYLQIPFISNLDVHMKINIQLIDINMFRGAWFSYPHSYM
jgi:hypothetical protein